MRDDRAFNATSVTVELTAIVVAMRGAEPHTLTVRLSDGLSALPSGPLQAGHRTLQAGVRNWVEKQTGQPLGYVEQLYTFGDKGAPEPTYSAGHPRTISIAYLALLGPIDDAEPPSGLWNSWYGYFPWEDRRTDRPHADAAMIARLGAWASAFGNGRNADCRERVRLTFATADVPWDEERALERYELLYEASLVPEASLDRGAHPSPAQCEGSGRAMHADHRRILATAISRLRAKIKYRPVLFELMPPVFTLSRLQKTAEALSGVALHTQNFRRLIAQQNLVEETGEVATDTGGRPAKLVRFRRDVTLERPAPGVPLRATRRGAFP